MASRSRWEEGLCAVASQAAALMSLAHELGPNGKEVAPGDKCPEVEPGEQGTLTQPNQTKKGETIMTRKRIFAFLAIAGLAALVLAGHVWAQATRTEFTGVQVGFTPTGPPDKQWFTGTAPIMHIRGLVNHNIFTATDPRMDGECYVTLDINLNLATGHGTFHAKAVFYPWTVDGTWECSGSGTFTDGKGSGLLIGHGTGELEGQVLHWWLVDDVETHGWILETP